VRWRPPRSFFPVIIGVLIGAGVVTGAMITPEVVERIGGEDKQHAVALYLGDRDHLTSIERDAIAHAGRRYRANEINGDDYRRLVAAAHSTYEANLNGAANARFSHFGVTNAQEADRVIREVRGSPSAQSVAEQDLNALEAIRPLDETTTAVESFSERRREHLQSLSDARRSALFRLQDERAVDETHRDYQRSQRLLDEYAAILKYYPLKKSDPAESATREKAALPVMAQAASWAKLHPGYSTGDAIFAMAKQGLLPGVAKQTLNDADYLLDPIMRNYERTRWLHQHPAVLRFYGALTSSAFGNAGP
jgi:hypothetical protein